jgi:hypothetical protein
MKDLFLALILGRDRDLYDCTLVVSVRHFVELDMQSCLCQLKKQDCVVQEL